MSFVFDSSIVHYSLEYILAKYETLLKLAVSSKVEIIFDAKILHNL
jgi:hypothetical protein